MQIGKNGRIGRSRVWGKVLALGLILALLPGCHLVSAKIYIPLAYSLTGLCIALLISPSVTAAVIGLAMGAVLGAAVYNNSLKTKIVQRYDRSLSSAVASE